MGVGFLGYLRTTLHAIVANQKFSPPENVRENVGAYVDQVWKVLGLAAMITEQYTGCSRSQARW